MKRSYFFGYGSLVNRKTHDFPDPHRAALSGWRRVWRHTDLRPVAFLTVVPDSDTTISGLIAHVPNDDWAALDTREAAYDRVRADHQISHPLPRAPEVAVYSIPEGKHGAPNTDHPVLLSYLDVVVQGYLQEFGPEGAQAFFETTDGWNAPILDDRAAPRYPRHQMLTAEERDFVDAQLSALSAVVKQA